MYDILHEIVEHLPIHDREKAELHDKITAERLPLEPEADETHV
jgi:hypothetical protein